MKIGVITGSGTYALPGFSGAPRTIATRFGDAVVSEELAGVEVVHVSRHREGHPLLSSAVTHQANVTALAELGVVGVLAATVCGALEADMALGTLIVFDDLHFLTNRLGDGSICTLWTEPGQAKRGHWVFDRPFSPPLREALLAGAAEAGHAVRDGGCYGHVDGPRFNTRTEIASLRQVGVTAVSQTAGPETVLCGEAELPYALIGYATDYANGIPPEPTPVQTLVDMITASTATFASTLEAALRRVPPDVAPVGSHFRFD